MSLRLPVYAISGTDLQSEKLDRVVTEVFGGSRPKHEQLEYEIRATSGSISAALDLVSGAVYAADAEYQWKPAKTKLELPSQRMRTPELVRYCTS